MSRPFRIDGKSGWWIRYTNTNVRGGTHCESARVLQEIFHRVLDRAGFPTQLRIGKSSFTRL